MHIGHIPVWIMFCRTYRWGYYKCIRTVTNQSRHFSIFLALSIFTVSQNHKTRSLLYFLYLAFIALLYHLAVTNNNLVVFYILIYRCSLLPVSWFCLSNFCYGVKCSQCDVSYIGNTKNSFKKRMDYNLSNV